MIIENEVNGLISKLKKIQNDLIKKARILETTDKTDLVFFANIRRAIEKDYEDARIIFAQINKNFENVVSDTVQQQIKKLKAVNFPGIDNVSIDNIVNNQNLNQLLEEANGAFFVGLSQGEQDLRKLLNYTQQLNIEEKLLSEAVAEGFLEKGALGGSKKHLKEVLLQKALDGKFVEIINKNGKPMKFDLDYYAEMVARTKLAEASTAAVVNTAGMIGADLIQVSAHNTLTAYDAWFEGKIFSINGQDPDFERAPDFPPFHPNCLHTISIVYKEALRIDGTLTKYIDFSNGLSNVHPTRKSFIPLTKRKFAA